MNKQAHTLRATRRILALALIGTSAAASAATVENFESATPLSTWTTHGDVSIQFSSNAALPDAYEGVAMLALTTATTAFEDDAPAAAGAFNLSGTGAIDAVADDGLAVSLGLGANDLHSAGGLAVEGSAASRSFTAAAGSTLSFRWNLLTTDTLFADLAFVIVNGQRLDLATALAATQSVGGAYAAGGQTGWQTTSITLNQDGPVQVSFGIVDADDGSATSALLVDEVSVTTAVPEPQGWALMTGGLLLMGAAAIRRRQR